MDSPADVCIPEIAHAKSMNGNFPVHPFMAPSSDNFGYSNQDLQNPMDFPAEYEHLHLNFHAPGLSNLVEEDAGIDNINANAVLPSGSSDHVVGIDLESFMFAQSLSQYDFAL